MPKRLPLKLFLETFKYAPRAAVNILLKNKKGEILLTKRVGEPLAGSWHIPGSYVMKGETLAECIVRVAKDELGIKIDPEKADLLGIFDDLYSDPRGHTIDIIYGFEVSEKTKPSAVGLTSEARFFKKLPENIGFNHREDLNKLGFY